MNSAPVLVVDDKTQGHHFFYLDLLFEALHAAGVPIVYVTTPESANTNETRQWNSRYSNFEVQLLGGSGWGDGRKPSSREFAELHEITARHRPRHIYLMMLEGWISLLVIEHLRQGGRVFSSPWSAIFIASPYDPRAFGGTTTYTRSAIKRIKETIRQLALSRILSDPNLLAVHLLDEFAVEFYNQRAQHKKYVLLADPVVDSFFDHDYSPEKQREKMGLPRDVYVYLSYGFHNAKKATPLLIEAFVRLVEEGGYEKARLLVVGPHADPRIAKVLSRPAVKKLLERGWIHVDDRRLNQIESLEFFRTSDCVCVPYVGNVGTSGVLLRGLIQQKQIVSTGENWMGILLRREGVGVVCQPNSEPSLREALRTAYGTHPSYVFSRRDAFRSSGFQNTLLWMLDREAGSEPTAQP